MSPSRSILLVGEGNFSFAASVSQSEAESSITATCLQRQEEALRHEGAAGNIQIVKDAGGAVLFQVDCRKLGECAHLQGRAFDRVVFNFPHCGRKSGVKKNRELLKNFFLRYNLARQPSTAPIYHPWHPSCKSLSISASWCKKGLRHHSSESVVTVDSGALTASLSPRCCVQVLAEDGEVHVSLCNGQGGTPADHPKREWHNSWQVAAMAAEAHLILTDVRPFESEKYQSYKCTGYRSQDKGFHVEKALLHVFTRSLPYTSAQVLEVEEDVEGEKVQYNIPAELSDYIFRGFLCSGSVHPVRLVQDFLLEGLREKWSVSMTTEAVPFLLTAKQLQACSTDVDSTHCYWIHLLQKDLNSDTPTCADKDKYPLTRADTRERLSATCGSSDKAVRSKGAESLRSTCSLDVDPEGESSLYVLRPSLLPQMEELLTKREELTNNAGSHMENDGSRRSVDAEENKKEGPCGGCNGVSSLLFGISGLVFRNVSINLWALPAFHELLLRGVFPSACKAIRSLGQRLEALLAPYGVSLLTEQGGLRLMAQPVGLVGRVFASNVSDKVSHIAVSLNLDLLAVLLFSLPDWRLLWSHDPRFLKQFEHCPSPGKPFQPFSLFPEHISFDISFWTGPTWEEKKFHAVVREASHNTVEQVKLIDRFSHPDLSQTSYCYRLSYHSNTHALSHTRALQFHKRLESFLTSHLQVTIR